MERNSIDPTSVKAYIQIESSLEQQDEDEFSVLLNTIVEGTASVIGDDFFQHLVKNVGNALKVRYAFVAEIIESSSRVRTLAFWSRDGFLDNIEYELAGSPCELVLAGEAKLYSHNVAELFPKERHELKKMGAESYFAIPLFDTGGNVLGHLAVIDDKPMKSHPRDLRVFRIFGARVAAELERQRAELALFLNEKRLSGILASTLDAIITIDENRTITLFNHSAERMLNCPSRFAIGKCFDTFLTQPFQRVLDSYLNSLSNRTANKQVWAPEGLKAVRSGGEEFPVDLTISQFQLGHHSLVTIVLRDLNDRAAAEQYVRQLECQNKYLLDEMSDNFQSKKLVSKSDNMRRVFEEIVLVAKSDSTTLILGETGVGKELIAHEIHIQSKRKDKPFIKLNCAALPTELIESELFGHEKGAFTGATSQRNGRFELADGGTLFLDEIGELTPAAQAKLLRVLQDNNFERVGGSKTINVDVRLIAATNRDLKNMTQEGTFRSDLYYRLNVFPIQLPPLRDRRDDIPLLSAYFIDEFKRKLGKNISDLDRSSLNYLMQYDWPGNIRELRNVIERAVILSSDNILKIDESIFQLIPQKTREKSPSYSLIDIERDHISATLERTGWIIEGAQGAAILLNIKPSTLRSKMRKLGISKHL